MCDPICGRSGDLADHTTPPRTRKWGNRVVYSQIFQSFKGAAAPCEVCGFNVDRDRIIDMRCKCPAGSAGVETGVFTCTSRINRAAGSAHFFDLGGPSHYSGNYLIGFEHCGAHFFDLGGPSHYSVLITS